MIENLFDMIDLPIWIKNKDNKIIFVNKSFKSEFDIYDIFDEKNINEYLQSKEIYISIYNIIIQAIIKSTSILNIKEKVYKQTVFLDVNNSENIVGILTPVSDVLEKYNVGHEQDVLNTVIDNIPELIFYKDKERKYRILNEPAKAFYTERGVSDVIGKTDLELPLDEDFVRTCVEHDEIVFETKQPLYIDEKAPIENSDEYQILKTIKTPIIDENGEVQGLVGVVRDITTEKRLEEKLTYLSYTDSLTKLYNRSYFDEKIEELLRCEKYPIGIICGDVNGLKIVNDTLGHIEGDKLLKVISEILLKVVNDKGFVFRWGGDEFITVLLNACDADCINFINQVKELCDKNKSESFKISIAQGYSIIKDNDIDYALRESENKAYKEKISSSKSMRESMIQTLEQNIQLKNIETKEHTERVYNYCLELGKRLNLEEETLEELLLVAKFHDIGKIGIAESILLKKGKLTEDEFEIIKTHSEKGYRLTLLIPELSHISRAILTHHERWDGCGYPLGLKGEEIPLIARIVSVVDAYDAMTNNRVYSKKISKEEAIKELQRCEGSQFDPSIVNVFCSMIIKNNN